MGSPASFTRLPTSLPTSLQPGPRRLFSRFELVLLVTIILFAATNGIYAVVYILKHPGTQVAAVAGLAGAVLLLLGAAIVVYLRVRATHGRGDIESGNAKQWRISVPIPLPPAKAELEGEYTYLPQQSPYDHIQLPKSYRAVTKTPKKDGYGFLSFWTSRKSKTEAIQEDREFLIPSERPWTDMSEDQFSLASKDGMTGSLWTSIFELAGEAGSEQQRRAHSQRKSRRISRADESSEVKIVITKPEPTASPLPSPSRPQPSASVNHPPTGRNRLTAADGLRSHPVYFHRDPSVRKTKSTQTLASTSKFLAPPETLPQRPRTAEPGPDKPRLANGLIPLQLGRDRDIADDTAGSRWKVLSAPTRAALQSQTETRTQALASQAAHARALRRAKNLVPVGTSDQDLRMVYRSGA
ncbi:hypothetical protein B0T22DRAFT_437050 [Podospora appendiculata]|uniref:Uncharacterized protein n=1 Tax=Podospora appendiculata TaxID=314037 RepID=A0AAE0XIL1_9PEZI|nr:hypothetical protein B0T22DRAFT_437050 [Podospora appendiculata]